MTSQAIVCQPVNTYEVLEHIMGITGLHPHSLDTVHDIYQHVATHVRGMQGVVLDVGCGSGSGTHRLAQLMPAGITVIGIDISSRSIEKARQQFGGTHNLSFYSGTIEQFHEQHSNTTIVGIVAVSVSMFMPNLQSFYCKAHQALSTGGLFIDAPFAFRAMSSPRPDGIEEQTYQMCGCNMRMHTADELTRYIREAGFTASSLAEHGFDLMSFRTMSRDYSLRYLLSQFIRNIIKPPAFLGHYGTAYLFKRTFNIFGFFLRNRANYSSLVITGYK